MLAEGLVETRCWVVTRAVPQITHSPYRKSHSCPIPAKRRGSRGNATMPKVLRDSEGRLRWLDRRELLQKSDEPPNCVCGRILRRMSVRRWRIVGLARYIVHGQFLPLFLSFTGNRFDTQSLRAIIRQAREAAHSKARQFDATRHISTQFDTFSVFAKPVASSPPCALACGTLPEVAYGNATRGSI
jgi:hypothetical protein